MLSLVALLEPLDARETARLRHVPDDEPEAPREGDPTDHRRQYEALLAELEAEAEARPDETLHLPLPGERRGAHQPA